MLTDKKCLEGGVSLGSRVMEDSSPFLKFLSAFKVLSSLMNFCHFYNSGKRKLYKKHLKPKDLQQSSSIHAASNVSCFSP